jgi:hypothetical protein
MRRLSDLLPGVAAQLGLDAQLRESQAIASWERLVGELVPAASGASRLLEIRPPQLMVSADDPITAQELRLRSSQLLAAFARAPGGSRLLELRITIRPTHPGGADGGFPSPV